jgi:hypothetical protein
MKVVRFTATLSATVCLQLQDDSKKVSFIRGRPLA